MDQGGSRFLASTRWLGRGGYESSKFKAQSSKEAPSSQETSPNLRRPGGESARLEGLIESRPRGPEDWSLSLWSFF